MPPRPDFEVQRERMVREQLIARGITNPRVLEAVRRVPRHRFLPDHLRNMAYDDGPLPIGNNQTISQPYIVALMTQLLEIKMDDVVLEIGTGSGYQTAVLCHLSRFVYTLERYPQLGHEARERLYDLNLNNFEVYIGDGSQGLADMAPFNVIIVTAAAPAIPGPLLTQLAPHNGRMVIPVGDRRHQTLELVRRSGSNWDFEQVLPVMFVPLYGMHGFSPPDNPIGDEDTAGAAG